MRDYRFHCEDCDSYSQCQYYHNRKGTSLICKEFQYGSSVIEQIRDEIEEGLTDYIIGEQDTPTAKKMFKVMDKALDIIDKYKVESEDGE